MVDLLLPKIKAPSLDGIEVNLPALRLPTQQELLSRFEQLRYLHANRCERKKGERCAIGDDIVVSSYLIHSKQFVPFSIRQGLRLVPTANDKPNSFEKAIVNKLVGDLVIINSKIPADYPIMALRSKYARCCVRIVNAYEIEILAADDPEFFALVGYGQSLDEVFAKLVQIMQVEQKLALHSLALQQVLQQLLMRCNIELSAELIDKEIKEELTAVAHNTCENIVKLLKKLGLWHDEDTFADTGECCG